ncbi:MAG: aldo/keto reductase [Spirochaetota bacterium]
MAIASLRSTVRLNNGIRMPMFGLGCTRAEEEQNTEQAVLTAINAGYRLVDTASVYENEEAIGRAVRSSPVPRNDLFLATKVWNSDLGYDRTLHAFDRSAELLGVDYVDLYLIHWPLIRLRRESWRALIRLLDDQRVRAIGVCNFAVRHLEEIIGETGVVPSVNQVEFNPFLNQRRLHEWCRRKDILVQTHTPLSKRGKRRARHLREIAAQYGKETPQLLVRWALQKGVAVLVRSLDPNDIVAHANVFDFEVSLRDMDVLDSLHENLRVGWDPTNAP